MKNILKYLIPIFIIILMFSLIKTRNSKIEKVLTEEYNEKYYVNELYESKEINYRMILSNKEKDLYDKYINALMNFEENIVFDLSSYVYDYDHQYYEKVYKISEAVIMDHPELINFGYPTLRKYKNDKKVYITINYTMTKEEYEKNIIDIKNQIDYIKNETNNLTEYEKIKYVYEYLGNKNSYGSTETAIGQSAYSAFSDTSSPVCAGYARASQIIFYNIGVKSFLIGGQLKSSFLIGGNHEWNIVNLEDRYYNFDVTQSSVFKGYSGKIIYLGLLNNNTNSYKPDYKKSAPSVNGSKYNYYSYNKLEYSYNKNNLNRLKNILNSTTEKYVELKIKNVREFKHDFNKIKYDLNLKNYYTVDNIIILEKDI